MLTHANIFDVRNHLRKDYNSHKLQSEIENFIEYTVLSAHAETHLESSHYSTEHGVFVVQPRSRNSRYEKLQTTEIISVYDNLIIASFF